MSTRTMFNWKKLGLVFDPTQVSDRPWLKEYAQAPATLIFDDFVRVYFSCRPPAELDGSYVSYSSFVDLDRRDLTNVVRVSNRPLLELGKRGEFDEFGTYPVSVIRNDRGLFAYYAGWTRCESVPFNTAIGIAQSLDDGATFKKIGRGPLLEYSPDEPFVMSGPKIRRFGSTYYLFYIAGREWILDDGKPEPVYKIRMATSSNGFEWAKHSSDLVESILPDEAQASPDVIEFDGLFHMFYCYRYGRDYRNGERGYRIGYAFSEDLKHWRREDRLCGMTLSDDGWDSESQSYPHVFELDGRIYMLYLGNQVGRFGFGLAVLER